MPVVMNTEADRVMAPPNITATPDLSTRCGIVRPYCAAESARARWQRSRRGGRPGVSGEGGFPPPPGLSVLAAAWGSWETFVWGGRGGGGGGALRGGGSRVVLEEGGSPPP